MNQCLIQVLLKYLDDMIDYFKNDFVKLLLSSCLPGNTIPANNRSMLLIQ